MGLGKMVVIDDEKDLALLMQELLQKNCGCEVLVAHDGEAGEALCLQSKPDVIFIDYLMPRRKGDAVVKSLLEKGRTANTAIVMMSGMMELSSDSDRQEKEFFDQLLRAATSAQRNNSPWTKMPEDFILQYGVTAFLPKPFSKKILLSLARELGTGRKQGDL